MKTIILQIESAGESSEVTIDGELSIGRGTSAQIVLPDAGLSRVNSVIFRDENDVFITDENSTNGTFVNGEKVSRKPFKLNNRDEIKIGNSTRIWIEILAESNKSNVKPEESKSSAKEKSEPQKSAKTSDKQIPFIPIFAGCLTLFIVFVATIAIFLVKKYDNGGISKAKPDVRSDVLIPVRVIDPLGGEDPEDIDDLIAILNQDVADEVKDATSLEEVKTSESSGKTANENGLKLDVPVSFWESQKALAMENPNAQTGPDPPGQVIPPEIAGGGGVPKQKAKLAEMKANGYRQPMDFADLAQKRLNGELIELPMATQTFFLDVGGNASEDEFKGFDFSRFKGNFSDCVFDIAPGSPQYQALSTLAGNFEGQKYDLTDSRNRKQMRIRLLRMFNKRALPILQELAGAFYNEFKKPLRVTSLTRSMDYQISLNKNNVNSFKVRGPDSLPPHTSGCAFDLSRKQMTAKEQNFVMAKLAEMERRGILDGLREGGANACFHVFIYFDGIKPKGF